MPQTFDRHLIPFLLLTVAAALAGCQRAPAEPSATPAAAPAAEQAAAARGVPEAEAEAHLSLANNDGHVRYDGLVDSEASRRQVLSILERAYGPERLSGTIRVAAGTRPPEWLEGLPEFVEAFSASGTAVGFEGRRIDLLGAATLPQREQLRDRARGIYPGYQLGGLFAGSAAPDAEDAPAADADALASLEPGSPPQQLVEALNTMQLRFAADSARIGADGLDALGRAARAIAAAPPGTRLRLQSTAADAALARQRAEAVKVQLILNGVSPAMIETEAAAGADGLVFSLAG